MSNNVDTMAIASLLDGRHFYIPAYQRGYRWTKKQVEDLLKDLYTFALKRNKKEGEFYCLQPLIVQRVTDRQIIDECTCEGAGNKEVWELIDGQQRLTSIFILYKYLLEQRGWDKARLKEMVDKELYHLYFETRKDSKEFLENLDSTHLDGNDIDANHICEAYRIIDRWITDEAPLLSKRYERSSYKESVQNVLFSLLNCNKEDVHESNGSVQVIWYELEADVNQNPIKEFLRINNGKIKLTNAELIKALFLQKRNFEGGEKEIKQIEIALQWENIENTLHKDDFWYYLNGRGKNLPNRIDFLLGLLYKVENLNTDKRIDERLKELNTRLKEDEDTVFRFYNEKFEGLQGVDLQQVIKAEWHKIIACFRLLEDWYENPTIYNYIGYLSQCGIDISEVYCYYQAMEENKTKDDFENYLKERVKQTLSSLGYENCEIQAHYKKQRSAIRNLLLFFNINQMNEQLKGLKEKQQRSKHASDNDLSAFDSPIYKFPFDVFVSQDWDVEHIDSATENELKSEDEKKTWIDTAKADLVITDTKILDKIEMLEQQGQWMGVINLLQELGGEMEADEDEKNGIGNLTLLDAETNRSYGNSLFVTKRRIIIERIEAGVFVPACTQWVFAKYFDKLGINRSCWGQEDKRNYHNCIVEKLERYLTAK